MVVGVLPGYNNAMKEQCTLTRSAEGRKLRRLRRVRTKVSNSKVRTKASKASKAEDKDFEGFEGEDEGGLREQKSKNVLHTQQEKP